MHICTCCIMCSHRVQKAGRRSSEVDDIWGRSRRGDGTCVAARQRALRGGGLDCKRKRRPDHVHRMGISGCVGGPAPPKHYCSAGGGRIATPATPGGDCSRASGWSVSGGSVSCWQRSARADALLKPQSAVLSALIRGRRDSPLWGRLPGTVWRSGEGGGSGCK